MSSLIDIPFLIEFVFSFLLMLVSSSDFKLKKNIYYPPSRLGNKSIENSEKDTDEKNSKKKVVYVVKITNIDTSLKIKDINRYFNGCGCCIQKFPAIDGKSKGYGEIHFSKKETAKLTIQKYNNMSICGTKKILMKLKKRITKGE